MPMPTLLGLTGDVVAAGAPPSGDEPDPIGAASQ